MSFEDVQITIPDLDDDALYSTPIPFGRTPGGSGFGYGGTGSGQESPTAMTPLALPERAEKSYFHSRNDSATSEDSSQSFTTRYTPTSKPTTSFGHAASASISTTNTPFTKKPSFASIRNAFKSGKSNEPPPVPSLDREAYPVLKNPFNRSNSSLAYPPPSKRSIVTTASPPQGRPPTPGSDARYRGTPAKSKGHAPARSQHSYTGSVFHSSDNGSDLGHGYYPSSSPPPLPPMPDVFSNSRDETPSLDYEDNIVMEPRTPAEYALHAIFMRFVTSAESKIEAFLKEPLDHDPMLEDSMGPGVDPKFDDLLNSLGKVARKNAKPVIDSVMRWRRSQHGEISSDVLRVHLSQSPSAGRGVKPQDSRYIVAERKSLASVYIMCRALIAVMQSISKDALGDAVGYELEDVTFEQFKTPYLKLLNQSGNHRTNAELYATLLGLIANVRFDSVTDKFLRELQPVAAGQVAKDLDMKYESLIKGLRYVQIKVWPPEAFEEGAEFFESLAKSFANAHGFRLKSAFAETLVQILHPIGKTAQAEVNHPEWAKAIEVIYPRAKDMMSKPRYWHVAYPLVITSLCVAPQEYFLRNWLPCFEAGLAKLKDKPHRAAVINGSMRLIWTYLYRCYEPASTTTSKLDGLLKHFFPANRQSLFPQEDHLEPFIYMVHFILSRHFDFGAEFCLELMQEQTINTSSLTNLSSVLSPERLAISVKAILLSLHLMEREERTPSWPNNPDFSTFFYAEDYPTSSAYLPETVSQKPGVQDTLDRCSIVLARIAEVSANAIVQMSVLDDQWSANRLTAAYEESHNYVLHRHPEGVIAYPISHIPHIGFLQTCFESWPRFLHSTLTVDDALDMLVRGLVHVEPNLADAASGALHRLMESDDRALSVLTRFSKFLFGPHCISHEGSGVKLTVESAKLLGTWTSLVDGWIHGLLQISPDDFSEKTADVMVVVDELEAGSLFLLTHVERRLRSTGVEVLRALRLLVNRIVAEVSSEPEARSPARLLDLFHDKALNKAYLDGYDDLIKRDEDLDRLRQWRQSQRADIPLRIADSTDGRDYAVWEHVYPTLIRLGLSSHGQVVGRLREAVVAAASRYHPLMAAIAGIHNRATTGLPARNQSGGEKEGTKLVLDNTNYIKQWRMWMKILCSTASSEIRTAMVNREHARVPSEANFDRERMTTTRGLFRLLAPFLDSEHTVFRDAAVLSISSFPSEGYSQLLDDLNNLAARQFYDDRFKTNTPPAPSRTRRQERFYAAVARIYYLTAHLILDQRAAARQPALSNILKFVRHTQAFLTSPESRDKYMLQRLRRYFCGAVERLFDGMATLKDSDRFVPYRMHLHLYRLCEEWCQLGPQSENVRQRLIYMQKSASDLNDPQKQAEGVRRFQTETKKLSKAAVGAMASAKAFFPPEVSSGSPTDNPIHEPLKSLDAASTLDRWTFILASFDPSDQSHAKKALRSLLSHPAQDTTLMEEALRRAVVLSKDLDTSNTRFFEVVADVLCSASRHGFAFSQIIWLGLANLCHDLVEIRQWALRVLETAHEQSAGLLSLDRFEAAVGSSAPSTYLQAHRLISDVLAGEHPQYACQVLSQFVTWMPQVLEGVSGKAHLLLLQSLEYWISSIDLMPDDKTHLSPDGRAALYNLISLTMRYADTHSEQVLTLWTRLVDTPHQHNGHATIRFLLEQSHKVGSSVFINCASKVVACLSQSVVGRQVFEDICDLIEPARMLPTLEHKFAIPSQDELELWSDLDTLFSSQPRLSLASGQYALLFLADVALDREWEEQAQLPRLLHALFIHVDHRTAFVRQRARYMLFQLLRTWIPGYEELADRSAYRDRDSIRSNISNLKRNSETIFWRDDEPGAQSEPKMRALSVEVIELLEPLRPNLADEWGSLALFWGTGCSIRALAFRSLQVFRALMPHVSKADLGRLLGRLSSTIADEDEGIQKFTADLILTLSAISNADHFEWSSLPELFWGAYACLATTVEREYHQALVLLESLLKKVDLNDKETSLYIMSHRPRDWSGSATLQTSLLTGLRSSVTSEMAFSILQMLAGIDDGELIDPSEGRVRDLYTASLPWLLQARSSDTYNETLVRFATDVSRLAEKEGKSSISRILDSFANRRFRTTEDFLRQSVASLREHYAVDHWPEVVTLLLGLTLNNQRWLRVHSIQILKVLFQQRETRQPVDRLGSELLMPLLRLLETDLAPEALSVLEEPMTISGGPPAKHVLRMSMNIKALRDQAEVTDIFGIPQESGWCVARPTLAQQICRANVIAVYDTCKVPTRPSRIDFQPEEMEAFADRPESNLGDLVQNLHELSMFFQEEDSEERNDTQAPPPTRQVEARVAAILAKSTDRATDAPQTPYVDVFNISDLTVYGDSDEDSGSDSESDAFVFDSLEHLSLSRSNSLNGFHH
ncbi:hypothetical protein NEOLEDRAFT_1176276 [Neolentinus lepideus HHB14362 ss-1]|uniref:Cell morphogenesis protein n=1 Tax=Neolentinus lepideus HHB14362 ss-1 TaxID=1314782 RepID=A0A165UGJ9_9AGAM|nr:hypothetical protein NEOLEDRAFT_1176276 [Neolentinus lepideus HHB14362 ss-1]